jgi:hypothetical protein
VWHILKPEAICIVELCTREDVYASKQFEFLTTMQPDSISSVSLQLIQSGRLGCEILCVPTQERGNEVREVREAREVRGGSELESTCVGLRRYIDFGEFRPNLTRLRISSSCLLQTSCKGLRRR